MHSGALKATARLLVFVFLGTPLPAQVSFLQSPTYSGSGNVFVADFNGDGKLDVLTGDGTVNLGNGDGTFKLGTPIAGSPLAIADFNGDGKPDVLGQGTGTLLVLLGNGNGTFQPPISTASGASLSPLTAIDLNGDGKADAIGVFNNVLIVYLSKGDGTFAPGVSYNLGPNNPLSVMSLGDFNGDTKIDIALSVPGNNVPGQEIALLGNGDGTFLAAKTSIGLHLPASAAVGDFNGDGKVDLAVSSSGWCNGTCIGAGVYILSGNGDGTFQPPTLELPDNGPIVAVDLNGDGKMDLVLESDPAVGQIYLGNGDGTFLNHANYVLNFPGYPQELPFTSGPATGDFNHDGKADIAMGNAVLLGNADGTFQGIQLGVVGSAINTAVVGLFDKSGIPGVGAVSGHSLYMMSNNGKGKLSVAHSYGLNEPATGIAAADLNGDGNLDLFITGDDPITQDWSYSVLLGNGDGSFQLPVLYSQSLGTDVSSIIVGDFNGDKKPDVAIGFRDNDSLTLLIGNGDGTFAGPTYVYDGGILGLVSADFNGDGKLDIAGGISPGNGTALLFGNGDGTFQPAIFPANLNNCGSVALADYNNDGKPDLICGNQVALGNGDGTFTLLPLMVNSGIIAASDLNGDGIIDLLVRYGDVHGGLTGVLLGNGDGTFGSVINIVQGPLPFSLLIADMNGDGRPDIVFPWNILNPSADGIAVMLNSTPPNFGISASALSPSSLMSGNSATSDIGVKHTFGFSGTVTLTCVGLPNGASCQFNPASVASGSSAASLVITTTATAAAGTYPVQVQGSAGSLMNSATLSLVIQAPPDFALAASIATQPVNAGQNANFSVTITPAASFVGPVNLSCGIAPVVTPAPTCTLSSSSVQIAASGAQSVTVTFGTTAPMTTGAIRYFKFPRPKMPLTWAFVLLGLGWLLKRNRNYRPIMAALVLLLTLSLCEGCGGGGSSSHTASGTPAGTYTVTITATSGGLSHNTTSQMIVQ